MDSPAVLPRIDRSDWFVKKCASFDEMREHQIRNWQQAGCAARWEAAAELVREMWVQKGGNVDELRLQRSVTRVRARGC